MKESDKSVTKNIKWGFVQTNKYLNELSKHTQREIDELICHLSELPPQSDEQIKVLVKALKYRPAQSRKEFGDFVGFLSRFSSDAKKDSTDLIEHAKYLPMRMDQEAQSIVDKILNLSACTIGQLNSVIKEVKKIEPQVAVCEGVVSPVQGELYAKLLKFKDNIKHLEIPTQRQLTVVVELITKYVPKCSMVILFGSYAKGKAVIYDEKYEFGIRTTYQSDFDIMVVMPTMHTRSKMYKAERRLTGVVVEKYNAEFGERLHPPLQFVVESEGSLSKCIKKRHPFFTDIVTEGIMLYDNGEFVMPEPHDLSAEEIRENAQEQYDKFIEFADVFLRNGYFNFGEKFYSMTAFQLHQSCENYYRSLSGVYDNYSPKLHDLEVFVAKTKEYSRDLVSVFPMNTEFEKSTFKLLRESYIEARYNPKFQVTLEELEYIFERVEVLKEVTHRLCRERFEYYDQKIKASK